MLAVSPGLSLSQVPNLGAVVGFTLFTAAGGLDNVGAAHITGDIGTDAGAYTGFATATVVGRSHVANAATAQAANDVAAACSALSGTSGGTALGPTLGNGQRLTPDLYRLGAAASLNGGGGFSTPRATPTRCSCSWSMARSRLVRSLTWCWRTPRWRPMCTFK